MEGAASTPLCLPGLSRQDAQRRAKENRKADPALPIPFCAVFPPSTAQWDGCGGDRPPLTQLLQPPAPSSPRGLWQLTLRPLPSCQGSGASARRAGQCRPSWSSTCGWVSASNARTSCVACPAASRRSRQPRAWAYTPSRPSAWSTRVSEDSQVWVAPAPSPHPGRARWLVACSPSLSLLFPQRSRPSSSVPTCTRLAASLLLTVPASRTPLPVSSSSTRVSAQR